MPWKTLLRQLGGCENGQDISQYMKYPHSGVTVTLQLCGNIPIPMTCVL